MAAREHIRAATAADHDGIDALLQTAFGGIEEAGIVHRLRCRGLVLSELVAEIGGRLAGHIMLSRLDVEVDGRAIASAALAPLAVHPDRRRAGIGSRLVTAGLAAMRAQGLAAVIVVGHPGYYPRFGFSAAPTRKLASRFSHPDHADAFMALELDSGALAGTAGVVRYDTEAFGLPGES